MPFTRGWRLRNPAQAGGSCAWSGQVRASVQVKEGETTQVSLGCDGIPLSGTAARGGRPAASEIVTLSFGGVMSDALTDAVGTFSTRGPSPGRWLLSAGGPAPPPRRPPPVPGGGPARGARRGGAPAREVGLCLAPQPRPPPAQ